MGLKREVNICYLAAIIHVTQELLHELGYEFDNCETKHLGYGDMVEYKVINVRKKEG